MALHLILGCMYSGKCYSKNTNVIKSDYTSELIQNINVGDYVLGRDFKPKRVNNVQKFMSPTYCLEYNGGENKLIVSDNHQLVLWDTYTSKEVLMLAHEFFYKYGEDISRYEQIMTPIKSVNTPPFDPYAIGFFLSNRSGLNKKRMMEMGRFSFDDFNNLTHFDNTRCPSEVRTYNLTGRINFCQGLWDGFNKKKKWPFKTKETAQEISWILWSVGIKNKMVVHHVSTPKNVLYIVEILESEFYPQEEQWTLPITRFSGCGSNEVVGLEVEDEYVIVDNCIVGHNSSQLIHEISKYKGINEHVFCINSIYDTRHQDECIMTHDGVTIECCKVKNLMDAHIPYLTEVIGIDEAQFFDDLIPFVRKKLQEGKTIIVAGLDSDYKQEKFGSILDLIPLADTYQKKYALCNYCHDGTPGVFTRRIIDDNSQILVGAKDKYVAVCRKCYNKDIGQLVEPKSYGIKY